MISKSWLKLIKSLQIKKFRIKEGLFLVEGAKSVIELIGSDYKIKAIFCTESFKNQYPAIFQNIKTEVQITDEDDLEAGGTFSSNNAAIAIAFIKPEKTLQLDNNEYGLMLDRVKDPGNLGTIIRVADWYGIKKIVLSSDSVDFYNPKVITSSMGSFARVDFFYTELVDYIEEINGPTILIGAFMKGQDVHKFNFPTSAFIVMGNESAGIHPDLGARINEKITIPSYGKAESLNVAIATAIICDNWKKSIKG